MQLPLESKNLILRDFTNNDKNDIFEIITHPNFKSDFFPKHGTSEEQLNEWYHIFSERMDFLRNIDSITKQRETYRLAICLKNNPDKVIGYTAFDNIHRIDDEQERTVDFFIHPNYEQHGYHTEATKTLIEAIRPQLAQNDQIFAQAKCTDKATQKTLKDIGFTQTEKIEEYYNNLTYLVFRITNTKKSTANNHINKHAFINQLY